MLVCGTVVAGGASTSQAGARIAPRRTTSDHFIVQAAGNDVELQRWAERCETLLAELRAKWFGNGSDELNWTPKCVLVIHDDLASYSREVPGGERTVGSSWIEVERGVVVTRRIDVRGDRDDWFDGAMAHELIHVLLADRFIGGLPRWAEEGLAVLADPLEKQVQHDIDFRRAYAGRGQFRIGELVGLADYPSAQRVTTFYGQSASLVRFLTARGEPAQFVSFIEQSQQHGYDAALRSVYGISNLAELESDWLRAVRGGDLAQLK
jgi:hypothetical protein